MIRTGKCHRRTTRIDLAPLADQPPPLAGVTIAVARDAAFAFLYPANLRTLAGFRSSPNAAA